MPTRAMWSYRIMQNYLFSYSKTSLSQCDDRWHCVKLLRYLAMVIVALAIIAYIPPLRNVVFYSVIPNSWRALGTKKIIEMILRKEKNVTHGHANFLTCENIQGSINRVDWSVFVDKLDSLPAFDNQYFRNLESRKVNRTRGTAPNDLGSFRERYPGFMPSISGREQRELRLTFKVMTVAFDLFNITYFLCEGSMLGAFRHHGFIPWDDGVDVCLNGSDWLRVKQILHCIPDFDVDSSQYMIYKFFWEGSKLQISDSGGGATPSSSAFGNPAVRVPYIDLIFLAGDNEYIWAMSPFKKNRILYKKFAIFPLLWRPFEDSVAPVPRDYLRMCSGQQYDASVCVSRDFVQTINQSSYPFYGYKRVPCEPFKEIYPFVSRQSMVVDRKKAIVETLQHGDVIGKMHINFI